MKETTKNKKLKVYELSNMTWNKGRLGKYKLLRKINKKAFKLSNDSMKQ